MIKYPLSFKTKYGNSVIVSQLEKGVYNLDIIEPDGSRESVTWYENDFSKNSDENGFVPFSVHDALLTYHQILLTS